MKNFLIVIALATLAFTGAAEQPQTKKPEAKKTTTAKRSPTPVKKPSATAKKAPAKTASTVKKPAAKTTTPKPVAKATPVKKDDKGDLDKALAIEKPEDKIAALTGFLADYPKSDLRPRVLESLSAARVALGEAKFDAGEREAAVNLYTLAIKEAPTPYPERLFNEVISKAAQAVFFRGESAAAVQIAAMIETNAAASSPQLLALATAFLMMENGDEARRLAEAALKLEEKSAAGYLVLGMAFRLNFDLEAAAAAFAKAVELEPGSAAARRSLAEMKRALGNSGEALVLFDELLAKDPEDFGARNGRILTLFAVGKRVDAETELAKAIEANPTNVPLIAGAAYWYAANGESTRAIDLAGKAIAADPRYIWSHIALSRALLAEGRFSEAEQILLNARKYGNFPTLNYEIASTKIAGGFYREAAEELAKTFTLKDGIITTKLGRRVERSDKGFMDLLGSERRASIFEAKSADNPQNSEMLKALIAFRIALQESEPDPVKIAELADAFVKGTDKMRYHRQVYAASELLEKKVAVAKAVELSKAAVASVEDGLSVPQPAAPIMASELYASRTAAISSDRYVLVPDVSKQTLSAIARGRIEELAGWSLLQQGEYANSVIRYRRAVSILPENSSWWRTCYWRLGEALDAGGNAKDAVEAYVKSYASSNPDAAKYAVIETAYKKTNGSAEGLEKLIGANPAKPEEKKTEEKAAASDELKTEKTTDKVEEKLPAKVEEKASEEKAPETKLPVNETEQRKLLFDPVIVEVKKSAETTEQKTETPIGKPAVVTETPTDTINGRPRIVEGKEINADAVKPCTISVSQENISLLGGGGSVGIIVRTDGDAKQVKAESSNPKDIEVVPDPDVAANGQLLFVVRSLATGTGSYQVVVTSPCGKKEIAVKIR